MRHPVVSGAGHGDFFTTNLLRVAAALFHALLRQDGVFLGHGGDLTQSR